MTSEVTEVSLDTLTWNSDGLIPAIAQEAGTGRVMMVAWMNREALELTLREGIVHYWSRSRKCLWKKGETSGNLQHVDDVRIDCDQDVLLLRVHIDGATACHTGEATCFFRSLSSPESHPGPDGEAVLGLLSETIASRKGNDPSESWTARLLDRGVDTISSKITEEAGELVDAMAGETDERVLAESADLIYHVMVGLVARGLDIHDVTAELGRRFGVSGLQEKASR